jgi:hypothetical protein
MRKSLKKKNNSGNNYVWNDLLKLSIIPSMYKGGGHNKTLKNLYKPLGHKKLNKLLKGGFIKGGSTQQFPSTNNFIGGKNNKKNTKRGGFIRSGSTQQFPIKIDIKTDTKL